MKANLKIWIGILLALSLSQGGCSAKVNTDDEVKKKDEGPAETLLPQALQISTATVSVENKIVWRTINTDSRSFYFELTPSEDISVSLQRNSYEIIACSVDADVKYGYFLRVYDANGALVRSIQLSEGSPFTINRGLVYKIEVIVAGMTKCGEIRFGFLARKNP